MSNPGKKKRDLKKKIVYEMTGLITEKGG